jgi:hypothetical protein
VIFTSEDLEWVEATDDWVKIRHLPSGLVSEGATVAEAAQRLRRKLAARASVGIGAVSDPIPDRFKPLKWRP